MRLSEDSFAGCPAKVTRRKQNTCARSSENGAAKHALLRVIRFGEDQPWSVRVMPTYPIAETPRSALRETLPELVSGTSSRHVIRRGTL